MFLDEFQYQISYTADGGHYEQFTIDGNGRSLPRYDEIEQAEQQEEGEDAILFLFDHLFPGKRQPGRLELLETGEEGRRLFRPALVNRPELPAQELFLGVHDAFVVKPIDEHEYGDEAGIAGEQGDAQPHQEISQIERMPDD